MLNVSGCVSKRPGCLRSGQMMSSCVILILFSFSNVKFGQSRSACDKVCLSVPAVFWVGDVGVMRLVALEHSRDLGVGVEGEREGECGGGCGDERESWGECECGGEREGGWGMRS